MYGTLIVCLFLFVVGAAIGSFLGVIVDRIESKEPFWKGRSHCDHCRHVLHILDLIPIVSYFFLERKCRYCHKKLSWFYPVIEILTGISFALAGLAVFSSGYVFVQASYMVLLLYYLFVISVLLVIFFADLRYGIIPFVAVAMALLITIFWYSLSPFLKFTFLESQLYGLNTNFLIILLSAIGAGGFFFLLFLLTKGRGMGFGDVVYAFLMGFILGFPRVFLGLYIAFVAGAIVSLGLVAFKKKQFKGGTIPFGRFWFLGRLSAYFGVIFCFHLFLDILLFKLQVETLEMKGNNNSVIQNRFSIQKGFTLIELLVVLAILGIIAVTLLFTLNPVAQLQKANDAHRKSDLESLQRALELYYQDNGSYPASSATYQIAPGGTAILWGNAWGTYISKLPKDPISTNTYVYYSPAGNQSYYLYANLQQGSNDPQACNKGSACTSMSGSGFPAGTSCGGTCNYGVSSSNVSP